MPKITVHPLPDPAPAKTSGVRPAALVGPPIAPRPAGAPAPARGQERRSKLSRRQKWVVGGLIIGVLGTIWAFLPAGVDGSATCSGSEIQWRNDKFRMREVGSSQWGSWIYRGDLDSHSMCLVADASS